MRHVLFAVFMNLSILVYAQEWKYQYSPIPKEKICSLKPNDRLPQVTLCDVNRDNVDLSEYCKGHYTLIHLYYYIPCCSYESKFKIDLTHLYNKYRGEGFQIVGITFRFPSDREKEPYDKWLDTVRKRMKDRNGWYIQGKKIMS